MHCKHVIDTQYKCRRSTRIRLIPMNLTRGRPLQLLLCWRSKDLPLVPFQRNFERTLKTDKHTMILAIFLMFFGILRKTQET